MVLKVTAMATLEEEKGGRTTGREEVGNFWDAGYALFFYLDDNNCDNSSSCILMMCALFFCMCDI